MTRLQVGDRVKYVSGEYSFLEGHELIVTRLLAGNIYVVCLGVNTISGFGWWDAGNDRILNVERSYYWSALATSFKKVGHTVVKRKASQLQEFKEWYTKYRSSAVPSMSDIKKMEDNLALLQKQMTTTKKVAAKDKVHGMYVGARVIAIKDGKTAYTGTVTKFNSDKDRLLIKRDDMMTDTWICGYERGQWWGDSTNNNCGELVILEKGALKTKVKELKGKVSKAKQERKDIDGIITKEYRAAYRSLLKHHQIEKIEVNSNYLTIHTKNLKHEGREVELGEYAIEASYSIAKPHMKNTTYRVNNAHPHVNSSGAPCFGAYGETIYTFYRSGDVVMYFDALIMFLKHADTPGDCHMDFDGFLDSREER